MSIVQNKIIIKKKHQKAKTTLMQEGAIKMKQKKRNKFYEWNLKGTTWDKMEKGLLVMTGYKVAVMH